MYIGGHESISPNVLSACQTTKKMGGNALQIFLRSPRQYGDIKLKDADLEKSFKFLTENDMKIVVHSSYLLNFSRPIEENERALNIILGDLEASTKINAIGCIIHMGKSLKMGVDTGYQNFIDSVNNICEKNNAESLLILENSARQGTEIGYQIDQLSRIYQGIKEENRAKIGFCLDTCHAFAAGYDFNVKEETEKFFEEFDQKIGLNKLATVHFNNSKKVCNCHVDNHDNLRKGKITLDGLKNIVLYLKEKNYTGPIILETPYESFESRLDEVNLIKSWLNN